MSKQYLEEAIACQFGANHKATYTDSKGRVWEGMPLWFFAGFVDDADQHSANAFNESKALAGYNIVITGIDGYNTTISSNNIIRSSNYLVANSLNGTHIPDGDENWPLRFTGANVSGSMTVKGVKSIRLEPVLQSTKSKIGVFRNNHDWYVDYNGNGNWDGNVIDRQYALGRAGDMPTSGDWNGEGKTEIGVFRDNHTWYIDYNGNGVWDAAVGGDRIYTMGQPGDIPVPGDWNGDNKTEMAVFRDNHTWYIDYNGNGVWDAAVGGDRIYITGKPGDIPVPGDWNGDNKTEMAVFRDNHTWYIDYNGNGVWDAAVGGDRIYTMGQPGDIPLPGDWNGDTMSEMGVFRPSNHLFYLDFNGNGVWDGSPIDNRYDFGSNGDIPVSGKWA